MKNEDDMAEYDTVDEIVAAIFGAEGSDIQSSTATIWDELNDWGKSLANWQRFIVSHAVRDGALSDERVNEAYQLFLRDNGLDVGDEELPDIPASVNCQIYFPCPLAACTAQPDFQ